MNVKISGKLRHELEVGGQILPEAAPIIPNSRFGFYEKMSHEKNVAGGHDLSGGGCCFCR